MRREGRQHGFVRTIISSSNRNMVANKFDSFLTAGIFQQVSCKPTNHSRFTGVCHGCRALPVAKSKGKAKGNHKLKSNDVTMNQKFIAWRVMDTQERSNYIGLSASEVLDGLLTDDLDEYECDDEHVEEEDRDDVGEFSGEFTFDLDKTEVPNVDHVVNDEIAGQSDELKFGGFDIEDHDDDDDEYEMVFCNIIIDCGSEGEEGWCLVDEET